MPEADPRGSGGERIRSLRTSKTDDTSVRYECGSRPLTDASRSDRRRTDEPLTPAERQDECGRAHGTSAPGEPVNSLHSGVACSFGRRHAPPWLKLLLPLRCRQTSAKGSREGQVARDSSRVVDYANYQQARIPRPNRVGFPLD